jgi:hypothetical protein
MRPAPPPRSPPRSRAAPSPSGAGPGAALDAMGTCSWQVGAACERDPVRGGAGRPPRPVGTHRTTPVTATSASTPLRASGSCLWPSAGACCRNSSISCAVATSASSMGSSVAIGDAVWWGGLDPRVGSDTTDRGRGATTAHLRLALLGMAAMAAAAFAWQQCHASSSGEQHPAMAPHTRPAPQGTAEDLERLEGRLWQFLGQCLGSQVRCAAGRPAQVQVNALQLTSRILIALGCMAADPRPRAGPQHRHAADSRPGAGLPPDPQHLGRGKCRHACTGVASPAAARALLRPLLPPRLGAPAPRPSLHLPSPSRMLPPHLAAPPPAAAPGAGWQCPAQQPAGPGHSPAPADPPVSQRLRPHLPRGRGGAATPAGPARRQQRHQRPGAAGRSVPACCASTPVCPLSGRSARPCAPHCPCWRPGARQPSTAADPDRPPWTAGLDQLECVDLRGNQLSDSDMLLYLHSCPALQRLALAGNPVAGDPGYRRQVRRDTTQAMGRQPRGEWVECGVWHRRGAGCWGMLPTAAQCALHPVCRRPSCCRSSCTWTTNTSRAGPRGAHTQARPSRRRARRWVDGWGGGTGGGVRGWGGVGGVQHSRPPRGAACVLRVTRSIATKCLCYRGRWHEPGWSLQRADDRGGCLPAALGCAGAACHHGTAPRVAGLQGPEAGAAASAPGADGGAPKGEGGRDGSAAECSRSSSCVLLGSPPLSRRSSTGSCGGGSGGADGGSGGGGGGGGHGPLIPSRPSTSASRPSTGLSLAGRQWGSFISSEVGCGRALVGAGGEGARGLLQDWPGLRPRKLCMHARHFAGPAVLCCCCCRRGIAATGPAPAAAAAGQLPTATPQPLGCCPGMPPNTWPPGPARPPAQHSRPRSLRPHS